MPFNSQGIYNLSCKLLAAGGSQTGFPAKSSKENLRR
jgi:hypothetical protein